MNLVEAKESLFKNGYCDFDLKDFSEESYDEFLKIKYNTSDTDYLERFTRVKFDFHDDNTNTHIQSSNKFKNFENANTEKNNLLNSYNEEYAAQIWLFSDNVPQENDNRIISQTYYKILKHFYNQTKDYVRCGLQWTCYSEGCFLKDHNDGQGDEYQNTCAILIYLNDEWEEEWGGNLLLRNTKIAHSLDIKTSHKVVPKFGRVAIIDLEVFDTAHAVEKIIGDHNRITLLAFATQIEKRKPKFM